MSDIKDVLCTPQPIYVIVESVSSKGGIPQIGNTIGPELRQVQRYVAQLCAEEDMFYKGERVEGFPSTFQYLMEFVTPGVQITTRPNGKRGFVLQYAGFRNHFRPFTDLPLLPESVTKERVWNTWSPFLYGTDPLPDVRLYGDRSVMFANFGGMDAPKAVAIYSQLTRRREVLAPAEAGALLRELLDFGLPGLGSSRGTR